MSRRFALLASCLLAQANAADVWACSCASQEHPAKALESADLVFVGTVLSTDTRGGCGGCAGKGSTTFRVSEEFKGVRIGDHVDLDYTLGTYCCGGWPAFAVGSGWLIFAGADGSLHTSLSLAVGGTHATYEYEVCPGDSGFTAPDETCADFEMNTDEVLEALRQATGP